MWGSKSWEPRAPRVRSIVLPSLLLDVARIRTMYKFREEWLRSLCSHREVRTIGSPRPGLVAQVKWCLNPSSLIRRAEWICCPFDQFRVVHPSVLAEFLCEFVDQIRRESTPNRSSRQLELLDAVVLELPDAVHIKLSSIANIFITPSEAPKFGSPVSLQMTAHSHSTTRLQSSTSTLQTRPDLSPE
jgi:hypothetical protein